jgi:alpha-amylase
MRMPRLTLSLAFHNHQPVGNFPWVFEQAYRRAYEPMVGALERHPGVRVALHYSGPLIDWLTDAHSDLLSRVRALVARGQVEIMTGGYYEPILPAIPDQDKHGQVLKLTRAVTEIFAYEATGLWLAERVWEPHLPKSLAAAGVVYTIVDDTHFLHVGLAESDLGGHFITEEDGAPLAILPSAKALRYRIPWATVDDAIRWLREQATDHDDRVLVMGDDGEKFGLWPGTYAHCWEHGWIEAFFAAVEAARGWLVTMPPGEWVRTMPPRGRIYLPTASYDEMTEWALPAAGAARLPALKHELEGQGRRDVLPFLQGGYWRHFLVKYPEINTLHKAMLRVSRKVWKMRPGLRRDAALDQLWQAQCNCPYWHGVFGGVYLGHIRSANFAHLIAAERIVDLGRRRRRHWVEAHVEDLDADGLDEVLMVSDAQVLTADPGDGGSVVAWDIRDAGVNLVNVITRRTEGYHEPLRRAIARGEAALYRPDETESIHTSRVRVKEWGLERYLVADWYRRASFVDHFLAPGGSPESFARGDMSELGDFASKPYRVSIESAGNEPEARAVKFTRDGHVWIGDTHVPVRVEKTLTVPAGRAALEVGYRVMNLGDRALEADFAVETNWGTMGPDAMVTVESTATRVGDASLFERATAFALRDVGWRLEVSAGIESPEPPRLWVVPIEVVSASEAGFERTFQGASLAGVWALRLEPGTTWGTRIAFDVRMDKR